MMRLVGVITVLVMLASAGDAPASAARRLPSRHDLVPITFQSDLLTRFRGAPAEMRAAAFVPESCRGTATPCGVIYHLPGYGTPAWATVREFVRQSARVRGLAMAHVFLDPRVNGGYGYFTDSQNNGPWDSALVREFIPYIERQLDVGGSPERRFLEGHSSGGWTVMWLQVSNPDFFRAVWAIAPDPLDFRHFYEVNVTPGSSDNFYTARDGSPRYLQRSHDITMRDFMQHVDDDPSRGGIISSYEFAWSPRGDDGRPLPFFDRRTGRLREATLEAWQSFDVHTVLAEGGPGLRNALAGKINIYCGTEDDFFYDEPTAAMCRFLRANHYHAVCRLVPGRTHTSIFDPSALYPGGLRSLILARAASLTREAPQ